MRRPATGGGGSSRRVFIAVVIIMTALTLLNYIMLMRNVGGGGGGKTPPTDGGDGGGSSLRWLGLFQSHGEEHTSGKAKEIKKGHGGRKGEANSSTIVKPPRLQHGTEHFSKKPLKAGGKAAADGANVATDAVPQRDATSSSSSSSASSSGSSNEVDAPPPPPSSPKPTLPPDDASTDPPDALVSNSSYEAALSTYAANLRVVLPEEFHKAKQPTNGFIDVTELADHGVALPHNPHVPENSLWRACDPRNATFSVERDAKCEEYLRDWNNMRSIKPLSAILLNGRTLKYKIFYHHGNLSAIVKVSQNKFFFEPVSEILAYHVDRALSFRRIPPTVYTPLPVDYLRAASSLLGPFYSQWFDNFVPKYDLTQENFVTVDGKVCANVTIQLWMMDVHSALNSYLAVNYDADDYFFKKFYDPSNKRHSWPPRPHRLTALGDICDRFIFDYIIGNTDRGMNDHNNFVYGGCDAKTACHVPKEEWKRSYGPAKYAFLDHGSSFHSHKEPEENPLSSNMSDIKMCRYRRSTHAALNAFRRTDEAKSNGDRPLYDTLRPLLPKGVFRVVRKSVFRTIQDRVDKALNIMRSCVATHGEGDVFSL